MKTNLSFWHLLTLVLLLLPTIYLVVVWSELPAQIPTHFDINGLPNGFTAKESMWWLCAAMPLGIYLLLTWLPRFDPKRRVDSVATNFQKLRLTLVAGLSVFVCMSLYAALHPGTMMGKGGALALSIFFALLGNYLTTVRPNYFVGIRTPWALEFPAIWEKTHRLGGRLFFWSGMIAMVATVIVSARVANILLVTFILTSVVITYGYSYAVYRQQEKTLG
ncbi:SdpI family protein [Hymenobacter aerilatus]|uniref:SdpI family protein n=1 Tax=Hymenobacter aerilatus TaxID=2932251 RepID=A0A8T9SWM7_9BACT|nr:SdpI family protein [Hymenobacter aerilatus]UOR04196.1 SdpI family protein [Hymenobacter aerilatus]